MTKPDVYITTRMVIPQNAVSGVELAAYAQRYLGYQYTLTGNSPALGFSCIGFVSYVYQSFGIPLPDDLWNARAFAPAVPFGDLRPGDILWFGNTVWSGLSHTAIYLGNGRFVHAAWYNVGVIVSSFRGDPRYANYWTDHYLGASRPWGGWGSRTPSFNATIAQYLFPPTLDVVLQGGTVLVHAPAQRLHQWWALNAPVIRVLAQATPLIPLRRSGNWYQVMTPDGISGWVPSASRLPLLADEASMRVLPGRVGRTVHRRLGSQLGRQVRRKRSVARPASNHRRSHALSPPRARKTMHRRYARQRVARVAHQHLSVLPQHRSRSRSSPRVRRRTSAPRHARGHIVVQRHRNARRQRLSSTMAPGTAVRFMAAMRLFSAPSSGSSLQRLLPVGSKATVIRQRGPWLYVRLVTGLRGYVRIRFG